MHPKRLLFLLSTALVLFAAALASPAQRPAPAQAAGPASEPAAAFRVFLPVVSRSPSLIYGRVTEGGAAAAGVPVSLRFYNGATWSTQAVVSTDPDGRFRFVNQPALAGSQRYQATFDNTAGNDNRLSAWGTRHLTSFAAGDQAHIGDFDIAAVTLSQPADQATAGLPVTFCWNKRPASDGDSYAVRMYDSSDLSPLYISPYVGYGDSFTLSSLPGGFQYATGYTWDVILQAPDGATGVSRQARSVRFSSGIFGQALQNGSAASAVPLQLRFFNGSTWSTIASTTTGADGRYAFTGAPSLGPGQKYYVRYENAAQTAGRLFLWSTRTLTAYTAGTAVDLGRFDIADVPLASPAGGAQLGLPVTFVWSQRTGTPDDGYVLEIYDASDYQPRWLSPLLGYAASYTLNGLPAALSTGTFYAWDVIVTSPDGGSGVSRMARLIAFANRGSSTSSFDAMSAEWPFEEELPVRGPEDFEGKVDAIGGGEATEAIGENAGEGQSDPAPAGDPTAGEQ